MRLTLSAVFALCLLASAQLVAQAPMQPPQRPAGTGLIVGQVVDAVTGKPIAEAAVISYLTAKSTPNGRYMVATATDADGHFVMRALAAGTIRIDARRSGYIDTSLGSSGP